MNTRVLVAAQFKAGKTTLINNVIRCLVDCDPFLGAHAVAPVTGDVMLLDFEMSEPQFDAWLGRQDIVASDRVRPMPLRGQASAFDLLNVSRRRMWADRCWALNVSYLVWDCVRPVIDALDLDEHKDAGKLLTAFDAFLLEAGIPEALVVQHMGHSNERARGDSRFRDWPDVEWRMVRNGDDPAAPRFISAYGRDVDQPEAQLLYDADSRRLTIAGGSRKDAVNNAVLDDVIAVISEKTLSGRAIAEACEKAGLTHTRESIRAAVASGVKTGLSPHHLARIEPHSTKSVRQCSYKHAH